MAAIIVIPSNDQTSVISGGQSLAKIVRRMEANYLERETLWNWENLGQHHLNLDLLLFCPQTDIPLTSRNSSAWKEDSSPPPSRGLQSGWKQIQSKDPREACRALGVWRVGEASLQRSSKAKPKALRPQEGGLQRGVLEGEPACPRPQGPDRDPLPRQ